MPCLPPLWGVALALTLPATSLVAATYYVAPNGDNAASGTIDTPWATIQHAVDTAVAGDSVLIRGGTYCETVTFVRSGANGSPITFAAYGAEHVTLTGFDVITPGAGGAGTWTQHSGEIYKLQLSSAFGFGANSLGRNQVAVDGRMMQEARWPNSSVIDDFLRTRLANTDAGTVDVNSRDAQGFYTCTYTDSDLAGFSADAWTNALMNGALGKQWVQATSIVTGNSGSTLTFRYKYRGGSSESDTPANDDPYYLMGRLVALDSGGEFFFDDGARDGAAFTLYLWKPGGGTPAASVVEMRQRDVVLDFGANDYITVSGLRILAGRVTTGAGSDHIVLDRLTVEYAGHKLDLNATSGTGDAVVLAGTAHTVQNSTIAYATGDGLKLDGTAQDIVVRNCVIHQALGGALATGDSRAPLVEYNTVFNAGSVPLRYNAKAGRFLHNHAYNAGQACIDVGIINAFAAGDAEGTEIAWNWAHDNVAPYDRPGHGWNGGTGIRLDCGFAPIASFNLLVHHNVVWNTTTPDAIVFWGVTSQQMQATNGSTTVSTNNRAYNNTVEDSIAFGGAAAGGQTTYGTGANVRNNLVGGSFVTGGVNTTGVTFTDNHVGVANNNFATGNTAGAWTFLAPFDEGFVIPATAFATDQGAVIAPYTDGFAGAAPDRGAYESGVAPWVAGAEILSEQVVALVPTYATSRITITSPAIGRGLPAAARVRIAGRTSTAWSPRHNLATHELSGVFTIDLSGLTGAQEVEFAADGTSFVTLAAPVVLPGTTSTAPADATGRLINLSIRAPAGTDAQTLIMGFVLSGSGAKPVLLRGIGPSLAQFGVTGLLADPQLALYTSGVSTPIAQNHNWGGDASLASAFSAVGAFSLDATSLDAAMLAALDPAAYTTHVSSPTGVGVALAELYDTATSHVLGATRLINVSARTQVGTGGDILIAGFVIGGSTAKTMLVRGAGPSLTEFGVTGVLADPQVAVYGGSTFLAGDDNWGGDAALASAFTATNAFAFASDGSKDAALLITLPPGAYTAQVRGVGDTTGVALVEVYEMP